MIEIVGIVRGSIVLWFEAHVAAELQACLEAGREVAIATQSLGAAIDEKNRHGEQVPLLAIDARGVRFADKNSEFEGATGIGASRASASLA